MALSSVDIDLDVVQKHLEEVGLYDKNMDRNEMISHYQALKDSKIMALEEDQSRKELFSEDDSSETVVKATSSNFVPKKIMADKKPIIEFDLNSSDNSDIPKVSIREKLNLTAHQRDSRKKLDSLHPFHKDDCMGKSHDETYTYTCRSGRHTKRINYSEELFDSICTVNKKTKPITHKKKTKADEDDDCLNKNNNKTHTKPTPRPALSSIRKQEEEQSGSNENHPTTSKSASPTVNRKTLSNDGIRSTRSLFAKEMEKARVEVEKKRQKKREMECFEKTLVAEKKVESQENIQVDDEPVKRGGGRKRTNKN